MTPTRAATTPPHWLALAGACTTVIGLCVGGVFAGRAQAQDVDDAAVQQVRELDRCISEHQTHLNRLVHLIQEAEGRTGSSDAAVARDAREAITTLVHRAHEVRGHLEACVRAAHIPGAHGETQVVREEHSAGSVEAHVSSSGGTVQEVHAAEAIGAHVHVTSGERVDGRGVVPHEDLRRAVRTTGAAIDRCYAAYLDRASAREGDVELTFAAVDGSIREVAIERVGPFDAAFRTCVAQAVGAMQLHHTSGRSVFAYVLHVGGS